MLKMASGNALLGTNRFERPQKQQQRLFREYIQVADDYALKRQRSFSSDAIQLSLLTV